MRGAYLRKRLLSYAPLTRAARGLSQRERRIENLMKVVRISDLPKEPAESPLFTGGQVFRQLIIDPSESRSFNFSIVNFSAGSRNKFHKHTSDQILIVTEGTGVVATAAEQRTISTGDVVLIPAGEDHWHGAPGSTPMSHITIQTKESQTTQTEA